MDNKFSFSENTSEHISDIKDYLIRIISNWKWFVLTIAIAMIIAFYVNLSSPKIYGLKATISVKEKSNPLFSSGTNIAFNWGGVSDQVESIRKALTTRSHNEKVVKELEFYIDYLKEGRFRNEDVYGETEDVCGGTEDVYGGTKDVYGGAKDVYGGTEDACVRTKY